MESPSQEEYVPSSLESAGHNLLDSFFDNASLKLASQLSRCPCSDVKDEFQPLTPNFYELIYKNPSSNKIIEGLFAFDDGNLVYYDSKISKSPKTVLNLRYAKLSKPFYQEKVRFVLIKDQEYLELTLTDPQKAHACFLEMTKFCILTDFHQRYEIIDIIEEGKNSCVCLVKSKRRENYYTAKVLNKNKLSKPQHSLLKQFLINEIEVMRALAHSNNIVQLYEVHETENSIYLITEQIPDQNLEVVLKCPSTDSEIKSFSSKMDVQKIIFTLLETLSDFTAQDILHRNIKSRNILIDFASNIKIANFGLATFANAPKISFRNCETPGYIAPEVLNFNEETTPDNVYDARCDVFSAGCIFFELLFRQPLYQGSSPKQVYTSNKKNSENIKQIIAEKYEQRKNIINKDAVDLLHKLLECDAEKRITATEALFHPYFTNLSQTITQESCDQTHRKSVHDSFQQQKIFSRFTLENVKKDDSFEKPLDDTCPDFNNLNELQPVEERYSYLSYFSNGKVAGTTKGIILNSPRPHLTIPLFHSANNSSFQASQQGEIFIETFDKIFGEDQSEVTCHEESDVNFKLRTLKDISLSKRPSRRSKLLEGKIIG